MTSLDTQCRKILKALIRNPRYSDNKVARLTGVPVRTVSRKRAWMQREGILAYYSALNLQSAGIGRFNTQQMIMIKFKLGVTRSQLLEEIRSEPNVVNVFSELIRESYIAEVEGHVALVMVMEGESDSDVAENLQGQIVPSLRKNHGEDSIVDLWSIRLLDSIRREHNYLPMVNMRDGVLKEEWPDEAIFVG
ncbi:MAG: winged helix-turn-helix transcriptional regulator [Planctomycetes bacterium]|nr:winged helix-turn-helix transcriptional regulator [Planctomycetota bacterium]